MSASRYRSPVIFRLFLSSVVLLRLPASLRSLSETSIVTRRIANSGFSSIQSSALSQFYITCFIHFSAQEAPKYEVSCSL